MKDSKTFSGSGFPACRMVITRQWLVKWSGGFAVARILRLSNGFHHY
jgi:hypothetical protein